MTDRTGYISKRDPAQVMRLARLGSFHQCRLSFMRQLTRRMAREKWTFSRPEFEIDDNGVGHAVYTAKGPNHSYSLVAFAHDLPADLRSDRVIANQWDATFALYDGEPSPEEIQRLAQNVPKQEAGRVSEHELSLSRANRSARLWDHVVASLANGRQPNRDEIAKVGYLMRTTAVYGSGKFGAADYEMIKDRPEMQAPYQAEMLSVWLTRTFVRDLVQHMARLRGGDRAVDLDPQIARQLGIGNSTGLGMAPYLINHPVLFNNWIKAREEAIARVRMVPEATVSESMMFRDVLNRTEAMVASWHSDHKMQQSKLRDLNADLERLTDYILNDDLSSDYPWNRMMEFAAENLSLEGQELIASLILEPYPSIVDGRAEFMSDDVDQFFVMDGAMPVSMVRHLIEQNYDWALQIDWNDPAATARVWYVSEEKQEPRLGERYEEPIEDYEQPLAPARDMAQAYAVLVNRPGDESIAHFLTEYPEHRHIIRRVQMLADAPYGEIRDNTISSDLMPIDMLRAKLSFFGATRFDPRSDRWVRICMYAGAPYPEELTAQNADLWVYQGGAE